MNLDASVPTLHDGPVDQVLGVADGWNVEETITLAKRLDGLGCEFIDVSSGGLLPEQKIITGPGYQVGFAAAVKAEVEMKVIAVGRITEPVQAESILQENQADMIGLARAILYNPRWPWAATIALGAEVQYAKQYQRAHPKTWAHPGAALPGNVIE